MPPSDFQKRWEILEMKIGNLKIETVKASALQFGDYQRAVKDKHRQIARDFDWNVFGVIHVGERPDGTKFVVDGRQRMTALGLKYPGFKDRNREVKVPCIITPSRDVKTEADYYLKLGQNKTAHNPHERFLAGFHADHKPEKDIVRVCRRFGITINLKGDRGRPGVNETKASGMLRVAYDKLGLQRFTFLIEFLSSFQRPTDDNIETAALTSGFVQGATEFLISTSFNNGEIRHALRSVNFWSAAEITDHARAIAEGNPSYKRRSTNLANAIETQVRRNNN